MVSSRTPRSDLPTRPPALMRGPSAKPRSRQFGGFTSRAASASAASPTFCRAGHDPQPLRHERAIEALQPRDVGDGAERDEIEQVDDLGLGERLEEAAAAKLADQRDAEEERHADGGEVAVRRALLAFVEAVGIDQRVGDREAGSRTGDDRRRSRRGRPLALPPARRTPAHRSRRRPRRLHRAPSARPALCRTGRSPPSAGRGCRRSVPRRAGGAARPAAPRWSPRRHHSRRRSRWSRRSGPRRQAASRPCPCP